jgi:hypothetical protein
MDYKDILNRISKGAAEAGEFIMDKAVDAKDYTVLSAEITKINARINALYKLAGKAMYEAHTSGAENAGKVEEYMAELALLHSEKEAKLAARQAIGNN